MQYPIFIYLMVILGATVVAARPVNTKSNEPASTDCSAKGSHTGCDSSTGTKSTLGTAAKSSIKTAAKDTVGTVLKDGFKTLFHFGEDAAVDAAEIAILRREVAWTD